MKKNVVTPLLTALLVCVSLGLSALASAAEKAPQLKQITYKYIQKASELMADDQFDLAQEKLETLLAKVKNRKADNAVAQQQLGGLWAQRENYTKAAEYFAGALAQKGLPKTSAQKLRVNLAQIYAGEGRFADSAEQLEQWLDIRAASDALSKKPVAARIWVLLGNDYSRLEQYAKVVSPVRKAINSATAAAEQPRENWYLLMFQAHYQLKQFKAAAAVLEEVIALNPNKKQYWVNLYSMQLQLNNEAKALAALRGAYHQGLFDQEADYKRLADFLAYRNIPFAAAQAYAEGMEKTIVVTDKKNLKKLANYWELARENSKAVEQYNQALLSTRQSADQQSTAQQGTDEPRGDAKLQLKIAGLLSQQDQHQKVIDLLHSLAQGATDKQRAKAYFLKGLAWFNLKQSLKSLAMMEKSAKITEGKGAAESWVKFLRQDVEQKAD